MMRSQNLWIANDTASHNLVWEEKLRKRIAFLSDTLCEGRATGTRGGSEAAEYDGERIYLGGDVIVSLNGFDISGYSDYFRALFGTSSGERVKVSLYRNGRRINTEVVLSEYGDESMRYIIR